MKDVAKRVGVSVQTVSAVINQKEGITAKTRERVLQAVAELNYRPYSVARSLRTGQSHTLALLITDIANPYLASIVSTAEEYAYQHGYTLTVYNTHDDPQREAAYIQTAAQRWIDGVIFISTEDSGSNLSALRDAGIPSVAFERIPEEHTGPAITLDNQQTGYMATRHLLSLGHRQIAHISGPLSLGVARDRVNGYKRALAESGIDIDRGRIAEGRWDCESGEEAIQQILRTGTPFTALFAANDRVAIGAMSVLHTRGITIPDDVSVIGVDDIEVAAYQIPALTTLRQPFDQLAIHAVRLLLELIEGYEIKEQHLVLEPELILRQSTKPVD